MLCVEAGASESSDLPLISTSCTEPSPTPFGMQPNWFDPKLGVATLQVMITANTYLRPSFGRNALMLSILILTALTVKSEEER